ncbi:plant cysteine oxidase 2-like [Nymphaea colorata]|nr:plant cysteine oxidase 2-like [Nymphaea colorata]
MKVGTRVVEKKRVAPARDAERVMEAAPSAAAGDVGRGVGRCGGGSSRKTRRRGSPRPLVQKVFDLCNEVFRGPGTVPRPLDVDRMKLLLDKMMPEDVGLSEGHFAKNNRHVKGTPRVTYVHIYECENFSIGIFLLPTSGTIPLHNHPGMTVFSKILFGSVHLRSFDWVEPFEGEDSLPSNVALARLKIDNVFTAPCNSSVLYPASGGNLHSLQAVTPCAVLDVLGPPYSGTEGRDCMYYRELPYSSFSGGSPVDGDTSCYRWLEEIEPPKPEDFPVDGMRYAGPQIVEGF